MEYNKSMNKGFTIIEILVAILIVGIISTLIISNLESSIEGAQVAVDKIDKAHDSAAEEKCKAFAKLYMIRGSSDSLYELNTEAVGRSPATVVGTSFGGPNPGDGQERYPVSITSHKGKLYMIGSSSDSFYELDTEAVGRSSATIVGTSFGGQENFPQSITSHKGKLYMIGAVSRSLYELNTEATEDEDPATKIGDSFGALVGGQERHPTSITSHNGKLYMIGSHGDSLYELDTEALHNEDPATKIGESFGGQENNPISITSHNGKLYMVGESSDFLYELDTTGRSPARKIGESFGDQETIPTRAPKHFHTLRRSITSHNGKLYMIGSGSNSLYELDTEATGDPATKIGTTFGGMESGPTSIAFHCNI